VRLDLPPAFFLGAYVRLAMLGGLGLAVLGLGAAFLPAPFAPRAVDDLRTGFGLPPNALNAYGTAQFAAGLLVFLLHAWWLQHAPKTEHEAFLRRAHAVIGALAFVAGAAVFAPLGVARTLSGDPATGEWVVAILSLLLAGYFASRVNAELAH
jgi:hypothetical protein